MRLSSCLWAGKGLEVAESQMVIRPCRQRDRLTLGEGGCFLGDAGGRENSAETALFALGLALATPLFLLVSYLFSKDFRILTCR